MSRLVFLRECQSCHQPIVLPRQSPLGIYEGQRYLPTDKWPITFVCIRDGQVRVLWVEEFHPEELMDLGQQSEVLWEIVCECGHRDCVRPHTIYTTCLPNVPKQDVANALYRANLTIACGSHDFQKVRKLMHPKRLE
jgi:hypothetical protein